MKCEHGKDSDKYEYCPDCDTVEFAQIPSLPRGNCDFCDLTDVEVCELPDSDWADVACDKCYAQMVFDYEDYGEAL